MCAKPITIDGAHADLFNDFIEFKRSLGYGYPKQTLESIRYFSRFISQFPLSEFVLTEAIVNEFKKPKPGESTITRNKRSSLARQFALYLESRSIDCYVPPEQREKEERGFVARIITESEMSRILECADSQPFRAQTPKTHIIYSMLIRMLWCCGLRIGEALSLVMSDVDLADGILTIKKAKYNQSRLVPMSKSLTDYASDYVRRMGLLNETPDALFFPNPHGQKYNRMPVSQHIKKIMRKAGIADDGIGVLRTHSIRHSYAVSVLKKMQAEGIDVYCSLPLLAAYLGHSDIKSTEYYLRLVGEEHTVIANAMAAYNEIIFPEVD